jgi:hypothetical protein
MATSKSSRPNRKKSTASSRRRASPAARQGKTASRRSAPARSKATATQPENPPLSPAARKSLALLKARGEKIVARLTASLAGKKPATKRKTAPGKGK